jgi:hypothetical protein
LRKFDAENLVELPPSGNLRQRLLTGVTEDHSHGQSTGDIFGWNPNPSRKRKSALFRCCAIRFGPTGV